MTTAPVTPYRSQAAAGRMSFWHLVHAEWTKFRTVRGWMIAMIVTVMAITAFVFLASNVSSSCSGSACPAQPAGPGGEPVTDAFYFAHQPLTGNGTITVQMTSLAGQVAAGPSQTVPGLQPWSKAGIIIKQNTSQGSAYAAMMVTGSHGVRMQWDYVNDTPGLKGSVSAASPRWLRLVRDGATITGYDSADGTHWTLAGTAALPGLTSTAQAGLFAARPSRGGLLAAKALVIGAVSFVTGVIAAALAVAVGAPILARTGVPLWPVPALTLARGIAGTGALLGGARSEERRV